ncbi:FtsX-like permease family protein [Paraclostridium ghonii]|uniref:ABC transporter permease n=1 Tax=Paraclostridium ghonii TaxID=29358 RepID=UPI00202CFD00|nr:FtsX-like permease family protein [Paeniclostridium ghonii]MCM0167198.1 FtsX-like permease family protein [Paeniclostridium ghonii]
MIKNYKTLSNRYIKQNKKRTTLTLIGIVLSLALISTIGLFMKGTEQSQIEQTKQSEGISFHIMYNTYNNEILNKVSNNPNIEHYGIMSRGEEVKYNDITFQQYHTDEGANQILGYSLKEGKMPTKDNEICIDEWAKSHIDSDLAIGDKIAIDKKEYKVVGFLKTQEFLQRNKISRAITFDKSPKNGQLMVEINPKGEFDQTLKLLESLSDKENIVENSSLIRLYQADSNRSIVALIIIVTFIVVLATIIVIYNSFQINVAERMKQFGLLRSIGATKKQIRAIVFREASILLAIAIPIGILLSIGTIYALQGVLELLMKQNTPLSIVSIDINVLIMSSTLTIIAVYISSFLPARYVGNISPLVAISSRASIKKESIKRIKNKTLNKILNFKALMALKNIGRNPKRCTVMILSVIVSATLFITFTTLVQDAIKLRGTNYEYQNIELEINTNSEVDNSKVDKNLITKIRNIDNVNKVYLKYPILSGKTQISEDKKVKEAGDIYEIGNFNGVSKELMYTNINVYDKVALDVLKKHLISGKINIDDINSQNGVILVSNGSARDNTTKKRYTGKLTNYKVNDEIIIIDDYGKEHKVKVMGIIENNIFEREFQKNVLSLITTDTVRKNLSNKDVEIANIAIDLKDPELHLKNYEEIYKMIEENQDYSIVDWVDFNATQKSGVLLIQVLVYGFMFVITLISSINIINTITMNITLRRKELSVLKSIGMSQKDLKKMIMYEGVFYGLVGGVIGSIAGCGFTYIIYDVLEEIIGLPWRLPLKLCIITIVVSIIISFLSTLIPMRKIEKDNVIEAIREG